MTETAHLPSRNGAELDYQWANHTLAQLSAALTAAIAEYTARCDHFDQCTADLAALGTSRGTAEDYAAMRHAHELATAQGKIVSSLNRVLREKRGY